jgi:acetyltransferase-like isoleucine patch superfamily enzyme
MTESRRGQTQDPKFAERDQPAPSAHESLSASLREQHIRRLSHMPWLYHRQRTKPHLAWLTDWQREVQARLLALETVTLGSDCFIAPDAGIFAEPKRAVTIGNRCSIAGQTFLHGPVVLEDEVSINIGVCIDGGSRGVRIGAGTRVGAQSKLYAFNHGFAPDMPIYLQPVTSEGIVIGRDVWIGAGAGITDGVEVGDHAVVGMGAIVTRAVPAFAVVAGVPARVIGDRRTWPNRSRSE